MKTKVLVMKAEDIVNLLKHYFCPTGELPLDAELLSLHFSARLQRAVGLEMRSDGEGWHSGRDSNPAGPLKGFTPLFLKYEGGRVLAWGQKGDDPSWSKPLDGVV